MTIKMTAEMADAARKELEARTGRTHTIRTVFYVLRAALDAAPTTEGVGTSTAVFMAESARDYWQERAEKAEKERDHFQETTNTFRDKFNEADARAERAEQERDEVRQALTEVAQDGELTPRELLDAAWEAAYVPEDGIIPAGAAHIRLDGGGTIYGPVTLKITMDAGCASEGRRLLDPPTPKRPEWADAPAVWADANPNADGTPHRSVFIFHTLHDQWEDGCGEEYKTWEMEHLNPVPVKEED